MFLKTGLETFWSEVVVDEISERRGARGFDTMSQGGFWLRTLREAALVQRRPADRRKMMNRHARQSMTQRRTPLMSFLLAPQPLAWTVQRAGPAPVLDFPAERQNCGR